MTSTSRDHFSHNDNKMKEIKLLAIRMRQNQYKIHTFIN